MASLQLNSKLLIRKGSVTLMNKEIPNLLSILTGHQYYKIKSIALILLVNVDLKCSILNKNDYHRSFLLHLSYGYQCYAKHRRYTQGRMAPILIHRP